MHKIIVIIMGIQKRDCHAAFGNTLGFFAEKRRNISIIFLNTKTLKMFLQIVPSLLRVKPEIYSPPLTKTSKNNQFRIFAIRPADSSKNN